MAASRSLMLCGHFKTTHFNMHDWFPSVKVEADAYILQPGAHLTGFKLSLVSTIAPRPVGRPGSQMSLSRSTRLHHKIIKISAHKRRWLSQGQFQNRWCEWLLFCWSGCLTQQACARRSSGERSSITSTFGSGTPRVVAPTVFLFNYSVNY